MNQNPYQPPQPETPKPTASRTPLIGLGIASVLFLISLFTDTLQTENGSGFLIGFACLLFGWGEHFSWFANPLLFLSGVLLLTRQPGGAACFAAFALSLMLTALRIKETWINEAGTKGPVTSYGPGFYLWIATAVVLLVTAVATLATSRPPEKPDVGL